MVRRRGLPFALAVGVTAAVVVSVLAFTVPPRVDRSGSSNVLLLVIRWPFTVIALGIAVALLIRYGPPERKGVRWASVGAAIIVAAWIIQALLFAWYFRSFANFTSASGALLVFLVLAAFLDTASIIFLVGVRDRRATAERRAIPSTGRAPAGG